MNDIVDFNQNKPDGMYLYVDKKNIKNQYALIMGLEGTPYFGGFFFFEIKYPDDYPKNSPSVNLLTIDSKVRFNPNLYENGKVCLSILGTWQGPSWTPVMNIRLVLDSIRSLMSEFPIRNEPGFENYKPDCNASIEYNQYLIFNTYKVAILDVLDNRFENISSLFTKEIENEMIKNKTRLLNDLLSYKNINKKKKINAKIYLIKKKKLDFPNILEKFKKKIK